MRISGRPYSPWGSSPFRQGRWDEINDFIGSVADEHPEFRHMADIVNSVIVSGRTEDLAACTSMHDLIVVPIPIPTPPYGVVAVRAPSSLRPPPSGRVRIEHLSVTGHDDVIERPVTDAVALFWRFMIEKFGVRSGRQSPESATERFDQN